MESCDPVGTPMEIKYKLDLDQNRSLVDAMKYRSMIGALMYLTSSRPDIVHATYLCAWYQDKSTEKHLKEVKRIFRYLRGTVNTGLWYTKDSGFELTGFSDADYADVKTPLRILLVELNSYVKAVIWMRTQLTDDGYHFNKIPIFCDSKSDIAISCNPTDYQLADLFTKALPVDQFNYLVRRLGMRSLSPQELERLAKSCQNKRDLPRNTSLDRVEVLGVPTIAASNPHRVKIQDLMLDESSSTCFKVNTWRGNALSLSDQGMLHGLRKRQCWLMLSNLVKFWMKSAYPGIPDDQAAQTTILNTAAFHTKDLDAYDFDCDDVSNAKALLMANLSNYGFVIISEKAQRIKPTLYDGSFISIQHAASHVIDDEETLILEEVSRSKMLAKQNDPMSKEKKVNTTPINYVELN
ncbi:hypothetical protein Tco_0533851 [Tanacetum coccineum]